jgi:hypothetical protein
MHAIRPGVEGIADEMNYRNDVALQQHYAVMNQQANQLGQGLGGLLFYLLRFLALGIVSAFPLYMRLFMNRGVVIIHMKRAARLLVLAGGIIVLYYLLAAVGFASEANFQDYVALAQPLGILGGVAMVAGLLQLLISTVYVQKTYGNGYGLLNIFALLPGVQPNRGLTVLLDALLALAPAGILAVKYFQAPETVTSGDIGTAIFGYILYIAFFFAYVWHTDSVFNELQAQVDAESIGK